MDRCASLALQVPSTDFEILYDPAVNFYFCYAQATMSGPDDCNRLPCMIVGRRARLRKGGSSEQWITARGGVFPSFCIRLRSPSLVFVALPISSKTGYAHTEQQRRVRRQVEQRWCWRPSSGKASLVVTYADTRPLDTVRGGAKQTLILM